MSDPRLSTFNSSSKIRKMQIFIFLFFRDTTVASRWTIHAQDRLMPVFEEDNRLQWWFVVAETCIFNTIKRSNRTFNQVYLYVGGQYQLISNKKPRCNHMLGIRLPMHMWWSMSRNNACVFVRTGKNS